MDSSRLLAEARLEIQRKTRGQIEKDTAYKWAARSVAAYFLYSERDDPKWLADASDYFHEAIEHAALADESGEILYAVRAWVRLRTQNAL